MKIVFATNNLNKLTEIRSIVSNNIEILSLSDINCHEELPETHDTLSENANEKARFVYDKYGFNCFADDTGLEVISLNGEPGVYSARYAGPECDAENNMNKLINKLDGHEDRSAKFRTVISLIINGSEYSFEGSCSGKIIDKKIGAKGFGYDPIFIPDNFNLTFAQMTLEQKALISHRALAVKKLLVFFNLYEK